MASAHRYGRPTAAGTTERRHATAILRVVRPPRAHNDNNDPASGRLRRLVPFLASAAVVAAALWTVLN